MMSTRLAFLLMAALPAVAAAHFPWLALESAHPQPGESLMLEVAFGDEPGDARPLATDRILALRYLAADGSEAPVDVVDDETMRLSDTGKDGVALLAGRQQPGYWSRTLDGGRRAPRSELRDVTHCSHSDNGFKALLAVGQGGISAAAGRRLGHALELLPLAPADVARAEAPLRLRLLFEGEALSDALVTAHALDGGRQATRVQARSDAAGDLELPLPEGTWMLHAEHSRPYPEPAVCDEARFHATLVLQRGD